MRAICEITVSSSDGTAPTCTARNVIATRSTARIAPIHNSVMPALRLRGSLKAGTPFAMASTPVSAVVPDENARRMRNKLKAAGPPRASIGGGSLTVPSEPVRYRMPPKMTVMNIITTKK